MSTYIDLEPAHCCICRHDKADFLFLVPDSTGVTDLKFSIVRCRTCGLIYTTPRPTEYEIHRFYPPEFFERWTSLKSNHGSSTTLERLHNIYRKWIRQRQEKLISQWKVSWLADVKPGRILDLGCAAGYFLFAMQEKGWEAYGVEISEDAANYAQSKLGIKVFQGTLNEANLQENFFDVITLWSVLEHLHAPLETLREANRLLKKGGLLIVKVPNIESLESKLFIRLLEGNYVGWHAPQHLYHFSPATLCLIFQRAGFQVVNLQYGFPINPSLTNNLERLVRIKLGIRQGGNQNVTNSRRCPLLHRGLRAAVLFSVDWLLKPIYFALDKLHSRDIVTVMGRKRYEKTNV